MKVLIAGCGDVGNELARLLMQDGHVVYGLKRDTSSLPDGVIPAKADLLDPQTLTGLPSSIDCLVYMPTPSSRDEQGYRAIFIQGLRNLWSALTSEPGRTLLVSSTAVYGESKGGVVTENTTPAPTRFNGRILLEMEQLAAGLTKKLTIARVSGIYGPGREGLIRMAAADNLEVQQSPPYYTNRIHRDDAAAALKHLLYLDNPQTVYLVSDDRPEPRYDVVSWLAAMQNKPAPAGLTICDAESGKRVDNTRLRDSGFTLTYPDYRAGYGDVLEQHKHS